MAEGAEVLHKQLIRKPWFDDECNEVIQQREKARMRMLRCNTEESRPRYQKCGNEAKKTEMKQRKHTKRRREKDQLVEGMQNSLGRWAEYFKEVFEVEGNEPREIEEDWWAIGEDDQDEPLTKQEIQAIIEKVNSNKAPGENHRRR
ncbi:hypothetical protein QE152_g12398 [Popillia japonica]|uniref:Uncharacterized protein n=1 Tax=Popillia japonica TaxID=7064 RepID=A0AAW1LRX7_POPJA